MSVICTRSTRRLRCSLSCFALHDCADLFFPAEIRVYGALNGSMRALIATIDVGFYGALNGSMRRVDASATSRHRFGAVQYARGFCMISGAINTGRAETESKVQPRRQNGAPRYIYHFEIYLRRDAESAISNTTYYRFDKEKNVI